MAIAVTDKDSNAAIGSLSVTVPNITPSGSDRFLIGFGFNAAGSLSPYSNMTYGGAEMTPRVNVTNPNYIRGVAEDLLAPATSAAGLVYTVSSVQDGLAAFVIAFSGVDQTTPTDSYVSSTPDTGDPMSISVTVPSGDMGVAAFYCIASGIAAGDTPQEEQENIGGSDSGCLSTKDGSASAMTATRTGIALNDWIGIAVNLNAATGGGGSQSVSPAGAVAAGIFGAFAVSPGSVTLSPTSLVARVIYGAFDAATAAGQTIEPASAVAKGAHGSFTLTPGAVTITHGDLVAKAAFGSFTVTPGAVTLTLNGLVAKGAYGALNIVLIISPDSAVARVNMGNITVAPGTVTLSPEGVVVQTVYGSFHVALEGEAAALVLYSRVHVDVSPRIT